MKISESWLRKWINPDFNADELGYRLTMLGHEVNAITLEGHDIEDIIIVEVVSISKHPNADKLNLCKINDGSSELIDVICGASNVAKGMKTAFARPGVKLPNGVKLNKAKIRGIVSNGMLCSANEIGLEADSDGIISLPKEAKIGTRLIEFLGLPDSIYDLDLTPNRGDCFSVQGIARDISALTGSDLINGANDKKTSITINDTYPIKLVEPNVCPRFVGQVIRG
jgi:phenylalanyl-tRNA synthetase beta chain